MTANISQKVPAIKQVLQDCKKAAQQEELIVSTFSYSSLMCKKKNTSILLVVSLTSYKN